MVKHSKDQQSVTNCEKDGIFWDIYFLWLHSGKRKHLHPLTTTQFYFLLLGLYSRIKEKYSTQYSPMWAYSKEIYISGFISEDISGSISVAYPIESFFWDFLPEKGSFRIPDLINPADILKNKIWCHVLDP